MHNRKSARYIISIPEGSNQDTDKNAGGYFYTVPASIAPVKRIFPIKKREAIP
jgi:hypothetical protein